MPQELFAFFGSGAPVALAAAVVAAAASLIFLRTRNFLFDALALAATETGFVLLALAMVSGVLWGRAASGAWWAWDTRLTSALVGGLLYAAYLMLRRAIEEPTQRATSAAVVSVFAFLDVPLAAVAIAAWRARRALPPEGAPPPGWLPESWYAAAMLAVAAVSTVILLRREERRRALDAERRAALTV